MRTRWPTVSRNAMPSRIFCCVFAPNPFSFATSPASHAAFSFSMVSIWSVSCERLHLLRPHARQAEHLHQPGGHGRAQLVEVRQRSRW